MQIVVDWKSTIEPQALVHYRDSTSPRINHVNVTRKTGNVACCYFVGPTINNGTCISLKTRGYLLLELQHCHRLNLFVSVTQVSCYLRLTRSLSPVRASPWCRMRQNDRLNVSLVNKGRLKLSLSFLSAEWSRCYIGGCALSSNDSPERSSVGIQASVFPQNQPLNASQLGSS